MESRGDKFPILILIREQGMNQNWKVFEPKTYNRVWSFIYEQLQFKPHSEPTIQLPSPFETKSIEEFFDKGFQESLYDNLHGKMKAVFQEITTEGERMMALNWQHDCYSFDPRLPFEKDEFDEWLISVFPNGDHIFFLTQDFQNIYYGNGIRKVISMSGSKLLEAISRHEPLMFSYNIKS